MLDGYFFMLVDGFSDGIFTDIDVAHGFVAGTIGPIDGCHVVIVDSRRVLF
jgi:hypothetical protein